MNKPQSYWEKRKARELYEELVKAEDTAEEMRQLYMASSREIQEEAVKLARRFQLRHNLTVKEAEKLLAKALDPDDIKNLIQILKQDPGNTELAAELESQAYASRINRLMAVQNSVDVVANEIYRRSNAATMAVLQDIGESMYYKQLFEMQQRAGAAFGFTPLDPDRLMAIINRRWSGQNFSERLWANREQLAAEVKRQLLLGILTGRANRKMAQEIDGRFSVSYNNTRRLVRTEANYVANQLQVESYKDTSVDKYIYVAILDLRTSEICRDLDKKRFLVSNAIVGENYPPMHPWCRSTTIAWMPDQLLKKLQQSAIDPATGETITVPGDMTYQEWHDKYVRSSDAAAGAIAQAEARADQVTEDLREVIGNNGSIEEGLPFRVKSQGSLARKIRDDDRGLSYTARVAQITDVLRFTDVAPPAKLYESFRRTDTGLQQKGYKPIRIKNTFPDKTAPYRGLNTLYQTPDGYTFELQFHTPQSLEIKEENHKLYEEARLASTSRDRQLELEKIMAQNSRSIETPKDFGKIKNFGV